VSAIWLDTQGQHHRACTALRADFGLILKDSITVHALLCALTCSTNYPSHTLARKSPSLYTHT
jgi:hypothetical protein